MKLPYQSLFCALAGLLLAAVPAVRADRTIQFQTTLEANNYQSDGTPLNESFYLEVGTFRQGFTPLETNTADWLYYWVPAPNVNPSPDSGSLVQYSTEEVPFGGPANAFQGFFTLGSNSAEFAPGSQAYFWVFDRRASDSAAEWILLTNAEWDVPSVVPGELEFVDTIWLTSDPATYSVTGEIDPGIDVAFRSSASPPHLISSLVAVPEPTTTLMITASLVAMGRRRRRPGSGASAEEPV